MKQIYLDNCATTPLLECAKQVILNNIDIYYNPASSYNAAKDLMIQVERARESIANIINADPSEIYFCGSGSEANTWALHHKITLASNIEHSSVKPMFTFRVESDGLADVHDFERMVKRLSYMNNLDAASCMMANNEIGVIQPIQELCSIAHRYGVSFHCDAVQAVPHMRIDVKALGVDTLSFSGHKFGGPKGVAVLYIKNGTKTYKIINGGKQEHGMRGGTTNAIGILAMHAALQDTVNHMASNNIIIDTLTQQIQENLMNINDVTLNVNPTKIACINGVLSVRINHVAASDLIAMADQYGIMISSGSACHEGSSVPSHVLKAIGLTDDQANSTIRISIGVCNNIQDIQYVNQLLPNIVDRLRKMRNS